MYEGDDNKTPITVYRKLCLIFRNHIIDLRTDAERQFISDCASNLAGSLDPQICDEDLADYLTKRQMGWINDIWTYLEQDKV